MEEYDTLPDFADIDTTEEVIEKVARRFSGSAGSVAPFWSNQSGTPQSSAGVCRLVANDMPPGRHIELSKLGDL
jgi:hypothetical protein